MTPTDTSVRYDDPDGLGLEAAWHAVREALPPTPLLYDPALSACLGRPVHFKLETLQPPGSFKVRGAVARIAALSPTEAARGVVACSSGNHGKAVAWAARRLGIPATICVPGWVDPVKKSGMESYGARVVLVGDSYDEAEAEAMRLGASDGLTLVHPFDDPVVAAGQGTLVREVMEVMDGPLEFLVALSGGGLAGGMAYTLHNSSARGSVTGVSAGKARVMLASLEAGHPVDLPEEPTLASALAGGIGSPNQVTFELVRTHVDDHLEVSEAEIARAIRYGYGELGVVLEGGGATALAALLGRPWAPGGAREHGEGQPPLVVVLSGGNLDPAVLMRVMAGADGV